MLKPKRRGDLIAVSAFGWMAALAGAPVAEEPGEIVTDRPDQTESAVAVPRALAQLEVGWLYTDDDEGRSRTHEVPISLLRIGLGAGLEARVGFDGWVHETERTGGGDPSAEVTREGAGDAEIGFKWVARSGHGASPAVALLGGTSLPVGADELSSGRLDPSFRFALSHDLGERLSLGYNLGVAWETAAGADGDRDTEADFLYTLSLGFGLTERLGAFIESYGFAGLDAARPDRHSADGGLTFLLRDNLQLDASAGVGLSDAADDWFVGAGVSVRLPR